MLVRIAATGRELTRGLLQLLYPGVCPACGQSLAPPLSGFCEDCRNAILADPHPSCPRCAGTIGPFALIENGCSRCRDTHLHFERTVRLGPYEGLLRELILRLKNSQGESLGELLGDLWAKHARGRLGELAADVVIPVPLHWWRHWLRGYNQSETLARAVAHQLNLPCKPHYLRRIRNTPQQSRQTPTARRGNVRDAFRARSSAHLRGKTVLLVDDVLTSGTTCSEAAKALRQAGAAHVVVAVLAHSLH